MTRMFSSLKVRSPRRPARAAASAATSARRRLAIAALLATTAIAPSGCGAISDFVGSTGLPVQDHSNVRTAREPEAELVELRHTVRFASSRYGLDRVELNRLRSFLARADVGYGDRIFVVATPPGGAASAVSALSERRAGAVRAALARERIEADVAYAAAGDGAAGDRVTVYIRRYVAVLPPCPDWSSVPAVDFNNQPMSNWSCATAVNLGMMLADPGDLVRGRDPGYADGEAAARTIEKYRKGKTKGLIRDASAAEVFPEAGGGQGGGGE